MNSQVPTTPDPYRREGEINLIELVSIVVRHKIFICGFTLFTTILAVAYESSVPPKYRAAIHLKAPAEASVLKLKNLLGIKKPEKLEKQMVFTVFLDHLFSGKVQRETFISKKYIDRLKFSNKDTVDFDIFFNSFVQTIKSKTFQRTLSSNPYGDYYEKPLVIVMTGEDPEIISDFLNDLSALASKKTIDGFLAVRKESIRHRLQVISEKRKFLINKSTRDRLSKIKRMKSRRDQHVRLINKQIQELQVKEKSERLQQIEDLSDEMAIASALNIVDNNFSKTTGLRLMKNVTTPAPFKSMFEQDKEVDEIYTPLEMKAEWAFPKWYLFGATALSKQIESLKNKNNNKIHTSEIANLRLQLEASPLSEKITTLEQRTNESPYIKKLNELNLEFETLSSIELSPIGIDVVEIYRKAVPQPTVIGYEKVITVPLAFVGGFLLSTFLAVLVSTKSRIQ